MRLLHAILFVALCSGTAEAQILDGTLSGLAFGDGVEIARATLAPDCRSISTFDLSAPRLPIAAESESELICRRYTSPGGLNLDMIVLRFADGGLAMVEARGQEVKQLLSPDIETMEYAGYIGYIEPDEAVVVDGEVAWVVTAENMHSHPFLGSTPIVTEEGSPSASATAHKPPDLVFGASLDQIRETFVPQCARAVEREISPPGLPNQPEKQTQIDCLGFPYAGFPRKVEAVFADGELALVWILTGKQEEPRVRDALIAAYGDPVRVGDDSEVFGDGTVVLRKDKPEVLFLSAELAPAFTESQAEGQAP
jgi:hypothetical protein